MSQRGRCGACRRSKTVIRGRSILDGAPIPYCNLCLDNNTESFARFKEYYIGVSGNVSDHVKQITVFYKGQYLSYSEALAIVLL